MHCGDVILPEYLEYFSDIKTTVVLGNNDVEEDLKPVAARIGAIVLPQPVCMEWRGKRLFLVHGHNGGFDMAEEAFRSGEWDFVCYGHSHVAELRESQGSTILNPGSLENGDFCILTASGDLKRLNINDFE